MFGTVAGFDCVTDSCDESGAHVRGALVVLMEKASLLELLGVGTTILSFVGLSLAGREEGIHFMTNKWISTDMKHLFITV